MRHVKTLIHSLSACAITALCCAAPIEAAQVLHGHVPQEVAQSRLLGRVPSATRVDLAIGLPVRNPAELDQLIESLSDPSNPGYRRYLTPEQFAERFGPTEDDYQTLIAFAQSHGLAVTGTHSNRMLLDVSGTISDVESAFHLDMMLYQHPVRGRFYAPNREPTLDLDIKVLNIAGLSNYELPHPMALKTEAIGHAKSLVSGSGPGGLFIGKDFRGAYAPGVTLDGTGQSVGLLEFDGFFATDLAANFQQAGLPAVTTQTILLDGFNGVPGQSNIEVILDIVMSGYMAPGAKVMVYEGYYPDDVLNRMATDNLAHQLSSSWGFPIDSTTEQIFKQFITQGQSFYQASGDSGAYSGPIMTPSDDPNVTVVGGTSLTTSGAGGPWQSETTWGGSGGGVSTTYAIPSYQQGISMAANKGSLTMRNIPDVALTADVQIFLICNGGQAVSVGGTSAATPLWAAFTSLTNQQATTNHKPPIGFANPALYAIGKGSKYQTDFHDISLGSNGFSAVTGYDLATGWGTPAGQHLIDDLVGVASQPGFSLTPSATSVTANPGATAAVNITVGDQNGFTGSVTLAVSGLPPGVTTSFSPASTTARSTLTFSATTKAVAGTSTVTVTGTSGSVSSQTTISLAVASPSFALASSTASLSVRQGASATSVITVAAQNNFTGNVALAVSGLPAGVTASFSPATTANTSAVTFAATANAPLTTANVTVTGTSGALKSTLTVALSTVAPNFALTSSVPAFSLPKATSATVTISVADLNGFAGSVGLAASGLPAGVTASFSPASTASTSVLTLAASSTATAGTFTVTVTGTSGSLTHTTPIALTVVAPAAGTALVNLTSVANVTGIVSDGATFAPVGLDGGKNGVGTAYSAMLLGGQLTLNGTVMYFGPANVPDAVSGKTVPLPSGQYASLKLLATGVNGNQTAQTFTVTYSDGTTSSFTQSLSDWFTPQKYAGEANVLSMPYRDTSTGAKDNRSFLLYGYSFTLNPAKKVSSIALPANRNVVVLAMTLSAATAQQPAAAQVSLSPLFDTMGITANGKSFTTGLDGEGYAYSESLLGTTQTLSGNVFTLGPAGVPDIVSGTGKTVALTAGKFSSLQILATGVNGNQTAQAFKVTYTDGTSTTFTQSLSDWFTPQNYLGEMTAINMAYRNEKNGSSDARPFHLYEYSFPLNNAKTVNTITLPLNANVKVLAMTLLP